MGAWRRRRRAHHGVRLGLGRSRESAQGGGSVSNSARSKTARFKVARAWLRDIVEKRELLGLGSSFIVLGLLLRQGNHGIDLLPGVVLGYEQGKKKGKAVLFLGPHSS